MTLVPASALTIDELSALFNAGYEGYVVPFRVDAAQLGNMIAAWHIDLARSRMSPGEGVALLGIRGDRGWIGGLGVVPAARRHGLGRALMEAVLADGPPQVTLEVIEQNEPALRVYEQLGFERVRILEVWSLDAEVPQTDDVRDVVPAPAGEADLPWQRADESLRPGYERLEVDGGAAVIRGAGGTLSLLQLRAENGEAARALIAAARARGTGLRFVNVPEGHIGTRAIAELGGKLELRQYEMRLLRA
jgi:GNAT superfamily N-acetyltransferase